MKPLGASDPRKLGQYTIEQLIDSGGMGRVYLGRSPSGQLAAVKVMSHLDDPQARERFQREFKLAQRVKNHYLAEIFDSGSYQDTLWYASEYIPGPTLQQAISMSRGAGLGERAATTIALALCQVLDAIHAKGITHRDLKPGNIILSANGPRVIDFGIAHLHGYTLTGSSPMGTHGYVAPERYLGGKPQASWDIFALGVIVSYAATGRMPFPNGTPEENWHAVLSEEPDLRGVPTSLLPFVKRCLDKNPAVRMEVTFVEQELLRYLKDEVRGVDWLPDYVATEVIAQTKRLSQEMLKPTRPYTVPQTTPKPQSVRRPAPKPVPRPVQRPVSQKSNSGRGGSAVATILVLGLLVIGGLKFGPGIWDNIKEAQDKASQAKTTPTPKSTKAPTNPAIPPAAKFAVGKKALGRAYDRADPTNSVTITKVTPHAYSMVLDVLTNDYNGIQTKVFQDSCVKIVTAKWSGVQYVNDFTIDFDTPTKEGTTKGTMTVYLDIPGRYIFLPNCATEKSVVSLDLGVNSVKNLGFLTYNGDPLPIRAAYRSGGNAMIVIPNNPHFDTTLVCVKTPRGPVPVAFATQNDEQYAVVTFEGVPKGSKLYFHPCDGANSYQGASFTLP